MNEKKLIINADDFGMSKTINHAISYCFKNKLINRTTLMVNMSCCAQAVSEAYEKGYMGCVGLHINLSEGIPLTKAILDTPFCDFGKFSNKLLIKYDISKIYIDKTSRLAIESEIRAQIEKYLSYGFYLMHMDTHQHIHMKWGILTIILPLLREYKFNSLRMAINLPKDDDIINLKFVYRSQINKLINKYNVEQIIDSGSIAALDRQLELTGGNILNNTETWIHPDMINGVLTDRYYGDDIEKWKKKWGF